MSAKVCESCTLRRRTLRSLSLRPSVRFEFSDAGLLCIMKCIWEYKDPLRGNLQRQCSALVWNPSQAHSDPMCFRRQVCYIYRRCGHAYTMPDEIIVCASTTCIFSPNHPAHCTGPSCKKTCWQYRQPSEQYSPQLDELCPRCLQG
ncbi:hypothetical protein BDW22DRAFT_980714 [Trametopsis cervina]|nr:hypothetical protein BDW22DRAFT_980714 [Trametopsis cervina]